MLSARAEGIAEVEVGRRAMLRLNQAEGQAMAMSTSLLRVHDELSQVARLNRDSDLSEGKDAASSKAAKVRSMEVRLYDHLALATARTKDPIERVKLIRSGLTAVSAKQFFGLFELPLQHLARALNISLATLNRKASQEARLSSAETEKILGLGALLNQVSELVESSGQAEHFEPTAWLSNWLLASVPALDGRRPIDLLDTIEGQSLVSDTLARMQSGAYV